jgi:LppP/LprE lipoprotein
MRFAAPLLLLAVFAQRPASWLDQPLTNWNRAGAAVPAAPAPAEPLKAVISRCRLTPPGGDAARAVSAAGWIPFQYLGKPLAQGDVEIVGGMTGADGMCRPTGYNVFVFVGGRHAGTLAPGPMTSRLDGASGDVRIALPEIIAEFSRYAEKDPLCCPSSRATVRFGVDRTKAGAVLVPIEKNRSADAQL